MEYVEIAQDSIKSRNIIVELRDVVFGNRQECYRSIFIFDEKLAEHVKQSGSVVGFYGKHYSEALIFDFDNNNLDEVKTEVIKFINYLNIRFEVDVSAIRIYFSGHKGFHITLPFQLLAYKLDASMDFWERYKLFAEELSKGFKFVDRSIYGIRRLIRMANSINKKSELYKIPLSFNELNNLPIEKIKGLASAPRQVECLPLDEIEVNEELNLMWEKAIIIREKKAESKRDNLLTCIRKGANEGNRHNSLIKIIGALKRKGLDKDFCFELTRLWNIKNSPPLEDSEVRTQVEQSYKDADVDDVIIYSMQDAEEEYRKYAMDNEAKVKTGFAEIDKAIRGISPGEVCCIIGKTSVGKSALLQNIGLNNIKSSNKPVLFFSLEMPIISVFERTQQIIEDMTGNEIETHYKNNQGFNANLTRYSSLYTVTKSGLTVQSIGELIHSAERKHGTMGLVLIDYLGLVNGEGKDIYQQVSKVARDIKSLAKESKIPIIYLSQITKQYSPYDELELGAARDSGAIDEAADFVIGIWKDKNERTSNENAKDIKLQLGILKNRKGKLGRIDLIMTKKNLRITDS